MVYADLRNWQLRQRCFLPEEAASQDHQMCVGSWNLNNICARKPSMWHCFTSLISLIVICHRISVTTSPTRKFKIAIWEMWSNVTLMVSWHKCCSDFNCRHTFGDPEKRLPLAGSSAASAANFSDRHTPYKIPSVLKKSSQQRCGPRISS
jgi:hypothetical protein